MKVPVDSTGHTGFGNASLGITWTLVALAIITVAARFLIRKRSSNKWDSSDWIMLLALVVQIIFQAMYMELVWSGGSLPFDKINAIQRLNTSKWGWISASPSILTSCIARISIAILLVRIFGVQKWLKRYLISFTALVTLMSLLSIIFLAAQCDPWEGLWDRTIIAKRWNPYIYAYTALATQFLYAISDLTFVLWPVIIIFNLNMSARRKGAIIGLISLSLITMGVVTLKIVMILLRLTAPQAATSIVSRYYQSITNLVASIEQSLVIILGCVPTLKLHHIKVPTMHEVNSFMASLVPTALSSRSRQGSSHSSGTENYQDLELSHRVKATDEEGGYIKPYSVTVKGRS